MIPALSLVLLVLAIAAATHATRVADREHTREAVKTQLRERLNNLQINAELLVKKGLASYLQQLVSSFAADPDLAGLVIADADGRIIAADRLAMVGEYWKAAAPHLNPGYITAVQTNKTVRIGESDDDSHLDGYVSMCGEADDSVLRPKACGFIAYRVDLTPHLRDTEKTLGQQTRYFVIGSLAVLLLQLLAIDLLVTRRAGRLVHGLQEFGAGNRDARVPARLQDELTQVGDAVNALLDAMQKNERAILDQRARLRAVFDTVVDAIIIIDSRGIIQSVNPATEQLFGYAHGELIGQNVKMLTPQPVRDGHDGFIQRYLETGERKIIGNGREVEAATKNGDIFAAELSVSEMSIGGERMFTGVVRDVSERVRLREAMEKVNSELVTTNQALWQTAKTDGLTGLANRRHFDDMLDAEIRRAVRQSEPLSLLLLDLDYFKQFNDHYGHYEGDDCLKAVAKVLTESCQRSGELPARYGGEEFVVILPHNDAERAMAVAERIRGGVADLRIPHAGSRVSDWVTTSIGVVTYVPEGSQPIRPAVLIQTADEALYNAKASGRNRIIAGQVASSPKATTTADQPAG